GTERDPQSLARDVEAYLSPWMLDTAAEVVQFHPSPVATRANDAIVALLYEDKRHFRGACDRVQKLLEFARLSPSHGLGRHFKLPLESDCPEFGGPGGLVFSER